MEEATNSPDSDVEILIERYGVAGVIRSIGRLGEKRYSEYCQKDTDRIRLETQEQFRQRIERHSEPPECERRERNIASAWLHLTNLEWVAADWEKSVARAGLSEKERWELVRQEEIEKLERDLARAKNQKL